MENQTTQQQTEETAKKTGFLPGERSIVEIIKDLKKPVAQRHIQRKKQGGALIDFISWYDRVLYLDHYAPGWENKIERIDNVGGKLILTVAITIPAAEGKFTRVATGQEEEDHKNYGDSSSNAEAMALSRASAKFGLGLYLYDKK